MLQDVFPPTRGSLYFALNTSYGTGRAYCFTAAVSQASFSGNTRSIIQACYSLTMGIKLTWVIPCLLIMNDFLAQVTEIPV